MAQIRKPEIEERIVTAARAVFAERGFAAATIGDIAARAGVSTGNVYRYFDGKDALLAAAVPPVVATTLRRLVKAQVQALSGVADVRRLPATAPYRLVSEELLAYCIAHRLEVVFVLGHAEGTAHAAAAATLQKDLVALAVAYGTTLTPAVRLGAPARFVLEQIYRGLVTTMVNVLARFDDEPTIRAAVDRFAAYHLTGLARLFATEPAQELAP